MAKAITAIGIMPITPTKKTSLLPLAGLGVLAVVLLLASAPALVARLIELAGDSVHEAILEGKKLSEEDLATLEMARARVAGWRPSGARFGDLALTHLERGMRAQGEERAAYLADAQDWQKLALSRAPADPYGWFRLAYLYFLADGGASSRVAAAWAQSMASAPYEPRLMIARLQMGVASVKFLSPEAQIHLPRLVRGSAIFDAEGLARVAKAGAFTSEVEAALAGDPEALRAFRERLGK